MTAAKKSKPYSQEALKLGKAIRARREAAGLTQDAFADHVGLHRSYVGFVERGERNVTLDTVTAIAASLRVSLATLFKEAGL